MSAYNSWFTETTNLGIPLTNSTFENLDEHDLGTWNDLEIDPSKEFLNDGKHGDSDIGLHSDLVETLEALQYQAYIIRSQVAKQGVERNVQGSSSASMDIENHSSRANASSDAIALLENAIKRSLDSSEHDPTQILDAVSKLSAAEFRASVERFSLSQSQLVEMISKLSEVLPYAYRSVLLGQLTHLIGKAGSHPFRQTQVYLKNLVKNDPESFLSEFLYPLFAHDTSTQWTIELIKSLSSTHHFELLKTILKLGITKSTVPLHTYFAEKGTNLGFDSEMLLQWCLLLANQVETMKSLQILLNCNMDVMSKENRVCLFKHLENKAFQHPLLASVMKLLSNAIDI